MRCALLIALLALPLWAQKDADDKAISPTAIEAGRHLFLEACSACHGQNGGGGHGPSLVDGQQVRQLKDAQLFQSIQKGVPGTDMPPSPLPEPQIRQLLAYVRSLSAPAIRTNAAGNPQAGRDVFFGKGECSHCHAIRGHGGFIGPDLTDAGANRTAAQLRESLLEPNKRIADGFQAVNVTTRDGQRLNGVAKNYDNYSFQILDATGKLHLLARADLVKVEFGKQSLMPANFAARLSSSEIQDVLAFLSRQSTRAKEQMDLPATPVLTPTVAQVRYEDIQKGPGENWLTYSGDFGSQRFSSLTQINSGNVASLTPKWVTHLPGARRLETSPLVFDGVMYATNTNEVYALDAKTGRSIWHYRAEAAEDDRVNRGVAILGDRVFVVTSDSHLVALHRTTGNVLWDRLFAPANQGYAATAAPLVVRDLVIVGVTGGGTGRRGFVAALDAVTGDERWRFWTVPTKDEPAARTWAKFPLDWGGAPTWTTGSFDPALNLIYWPTGNPWPDFYGGDRPGDNLYSDCILALDAATGKLRWYFQVTPHDTHDWDANETPVLLDQEFGGRMRKLVVQANRNGFYYVLDRETGEFLLARRFVDRLNWATGIDAKGRPIEVPHMDPTPGGIKVCPSVRGAANWMSPSYDPAANLLYVVALEQCDIYLSSAKSPKPLSGFHGTGGEQIPDEPGHFYLRALSPRTGEIVWQREMPGPGTMWAGTVATAGGIVFSGDDGGNLVAFDSKTGQDLWHFSTGHTLYASPVTFMVEGKQYVTIAAETDLITFGLSR